MSVITQVDFVRDMPHETAKLFLSYDKSLYSLFFFVVTEREVEHGILKASNVVDHTLAYIREISNINVGLLRFAAKFIDFAARNVDGEAQKLLKTLRDEKLPKRLPESNTARFTVDWSGKEGIDMESHSEYIKEFTGHFYKSIIEQVERAMMKHEKLSQDPVYTEVLQHSHACVNFCKVFQGRGDIIDKIKDYVIGNSNVPFILHGESGCGKTSLTAKGSSQVLI